MKKHLYFKQSALVIALATAFPISSAYADALADLISPNRAEASLQLQYLDNVNPLYRQYTGRNNDGLNGSVDADYVKRSEAGDWLKFQATDLGLSTQELSASYEKQGNWSVGIEYNQIPRYAPYIVNSAVAGIGTNTITQPSYATSAYSGGVQTNPALVPVTLKTERDITTFTASKFLAEGLKFSFLAKNEDKTGNRMDGVRGQGGSTTTQFANFLFAPEPISQNHKQFEATLEYLRPKYQIVAGYYGSFLNTKDNALNVIGGTNTAVVTGLSPLSLSPDNQMQQFYLNGGYNFSNDTRATLKIARSEGKQTDNFMSRPDVVAGIGTNLGAKVVTDEVSASLSSRVTKDLKLSASWRYEDKNDQTPIRTFYSGYPNNPESHKDNKGKLDADYKLGSGYSLNAGVDYTQRTSSEKIAGRDEVQETTLRLAFKKAMSETVNGTLSWATSSRTGSNWDTVTPPTLYPTFLADRQHDKLRGMIDWSPKQYFNLQVAFEAYQDDYKKNTYGLDGGKGQIFSLDGSYTLNKDWKINAWYSAQESTTTQYAQGADCTVVAGVTTCSGATGITFRTAPLDQWNATLKSNSDQLGFGITGKIHMVDVGADFLYSEDKNKQQVNGLPATTCLNAACTSTGIVSPAMGILPDTKYTQNTFKLHADYGISKATKLRLDYIYDLRKMDDYTWQNWVYSDGTRVFVNPKQTTQILGVTVIQSF